MGLARVVHGDGSVVLGVLGDRVEANLVAVRVVQHGQDPADRRPVHTGLLDGARLEWIIDSAAIIGAAETYLLAQRILHCDMDTYENWIREMFTLLTRT